MAFELTPLEKAEMRVATLSRQLRQNDQLLSEYREEVDDLQRRVGRLLAQLHGPQCLDEVIHPRAGQGV